jgi:hypothetical protein
MTATAQLLLSVEPITNSKTIIAKYNSASIARLTSSLIGLPRKRNGRPVAVFLRIKGEQPNVWITCFGDVATIRDPGRRVIGRVVMAELFYHARASGLTEGDTFVAPISLVQLGETVGMSSHP